MGKGDQRSRSGGKRNRPWHNLLLVVALGVLLIGCGGGNGATPRYDSVPAARTTAGKRVTIRFATSEWQRGAYERLIEAFEQENPDLHIQWVSLEEALGIGSMPGESSMAWPDDIIYLASTADVFTVSDVSGWMVGEMARMGLIRDLTPFIEADPSFRPDDFYPGILEAYHGDGATWALPTSVEFKLICYDREAFDKAGESYPWPGWTWDDFAAKAKALTVREGGNVTRPGFALLLPDDWKLLIEGRAGPLVDTTSDPPLPRFDRPEVIEAVRWYVDLLQKQIVIYAQQTEKTNGYSVLDSRTLYSGKLAAMWIDTYGSWLWTNERDRVAVVPFPVDASDSRTTPAWTQGLAMSTGAGHPEAAWRWMDFLSRQDLGPSGSVRFLPARRSVAETGGFWEELDEEEANILRYALDHSLVLRRGAGYRAFYRALNAILKGKKSVEDALAEAQVQAQAEIREALAQQAEATPKPTFAVASPEDEEPLGEGATTITFALGPGGSSDMQRFRHLARRLHQTHPDIRVEVKMADLFGDPYDLQSLANTADCFLAYPNLQSSENRQAVLSLEPFLEADPSFPTDDFYPSVLAAFTRQGQLWGLPAEVEPYVIEYNKNLFDAVGLDYPALDWTPDEFLQLAVALAQGHGEEKQYGFVPEVYEGNALPLILERFGARLVDRTIMPPRFSFDDPATVEALRAYTNLSTEYGVRPVFVTDLAQLVDASALDGERAAMIDEGRAAMWASHGPPVFPARRTESDIGVVPLPLGQHDISSYVSVKGYFVSAQSEFPQACWQWLTFLTGQAEAVQGLPARRSVAESAAYRQQVGDGRAAAYLAGMTGSERPLLRFSDNAWLWGATYWLFQAYGQVLEGEANVEEALDAAQQRADDYRACVMALDASSDQEQWQACLQETDPTLPKFLFGPDKQE